MGRGVRTYSTSFGLPARARVAGTGLVEVVGAPRVAGCVAAAAGLAGTAVGAGGALQAVAIMDAIDTRPVAASRKRVTTVLLGAFSD
jgi:hypothetical protein